jgi:tripeptidyl-peptidase I
LACSEYHVPGHLVEHIDYLTPGIRMRRDPRQVAKLKGRAREEKMSKRRVFADNTGFMTVPTHQNVDLIYKQSLLDDPFNSSTCWEVITNTCIRSKSNATSDFQKRESQCISRDG